MLSHLLKASTEKPLYKCGNLCVLLTLRNSNNTDVFPLQNYLTTFQCHSVNVEIIRICVFEWDHCRSRTVNNVKYYLCLLYSTYSFHYSHLHQPKLEEKIIENIHILETLAQIYLLSPKTELSCYTFYHNYLVDL